MKDSKLKRKLVAAYEVFYEQRRLLNGEAFTLPK